MAVIDFSTVSREFQGLVSRRREQMTFLGSAFAAMSLFLQNALQGNLPGSLGGIERHLFAFYAVMLLVPSLITALRMTRLHAGMIYNGVLYAQLMRFQDFTRPGDPNRARRHNFLGVSFHYFLLADLLAGFSATILGLTLSFSLLAAILTGLAVFLAGFTFYFRYHARAVRQAESRIAADPAGPVVRPEWEDHVARSLEEANLGMLSDIAFMGLIMFSVFEVLSSLGGIDPAQQTELDSTTVQTYGPVVFASALVVVGLCTLVTYIRVRVAIGEFSLLLDPNDRPFQPLKLTDSLLGYLLLAFLFAVSTHVLLVQLIPGADGGEPWLLAIDAAIFVAAIAAEQSTLVRAGRRLSKPGPPAPVRSATPPKDAPGSAPTGLAVDDAMTPSPGVSDVKENSA